MKFTARFYLRAGLVLSAAGAIGAFGACKDKGGTEPTPQPPPVSAPAAPTNVAATAVSETAINVTWADASDNEDGFRIESCSGASCTNFAEVGTAAANATMFANTGLTANTDYSYRVTAYNSIGNSAASTPASTKTKVTPGPQPTGIVMVGAGGITNCATTMSLQTAAIVKGLLADSNVSVFTAGNNLADTVTGSSYETCFAPKWGDFKARTYYAIGNGDFEGGRRSAGVYGYLGDRTGPAGQGWFSFDKGNWHIIILNTSDWEVGQNPKFGVNSEQATWLANDLSTTTKTCVMAISWERRIYTTGSGSLGRQFAMNAVATMLYNAGVDVLVSAKDKLYARFPVTNVDGVKDDAKGFRQFIVGTGGRSLDAIHTPAPSATDPASPVEAQAAQHGVLKFTLNADSYDWEFIPTTTGGFTDKGSTKCH